MEIKIDIKKGHLWILVLLLIGIAFVIGQSTLTPQQFGHSSDQITVTYNGTQTTLQNAIDSISASGGSSSGFQVITGTYTGDGATSRFIEVPNIINVPSLVWVAQTSWFGPPMYRFKQSSLHADITSSNDNQKWANIQSPGNNLKGHKIDSVYGFYVTNTNLGNGFSTNAQSYVYDYLVVVPYNPTTTFTY